MPVIIGTPRTGGSPVLVTTEPLSAKIAGAAVTPTMKTAFDAARKRRALTIAAADREAWAAWITKNGKGT